MLFGTKETFSLISSALSQDKAEAYEPICKVLYDDARILINRYCQGVSATDKEDLLQEVVWNVLRDLPRFFEASTYNTEQQRNAYLKRVVYNICMDFFRKAKKSLLTDAVDLSEALDAATGDDFVERIENKGAFLQALQGAFEINTTPERLIAFVFNRLIGALKGKNGSPKSIVEMYDGAPLQVVFEQMVAELNHILGDEIPDGVLKPLREKVYSANRDRPFHLTARQIADGSNWIVEKIKEQNKNER